MKTFRRLRFYFDLRFSIHTIHLYPRKREEIGFKIRKIRGNRGKI